VLVTRARQRCIVYSSIRSDDIDPSSTQARGVLALREFLYAAEHGRLSDAPEPGTDQRGSFEADVCRALRERGWTVHLNVGGAGFGIDLGVVEPAQPGRYLLGVECDGATYHSSPTARDRDRLRHEVLGKLGWQIQRVWSVDWFNRAGKAADELHAHTQHLRDHPPVHPQEPPIVVPSPQATPTDDFPQEKPARTPRARADIETLAPAELREAIASVLKREFGMSSEALVQSTARHLGYARAGSRIAQVLDEQIGLMLRDGTIRRDEQGVLTL
jgi:hypothetical protein